MPLACSAAIYAPAVSLPYTACAYRLCQPPRYTVAFRRACRLLCRLFLPTYLRITLTTLYRAVSRLPQRPFTASHHTLPRVLPWCYMRTRLYLYCGFWVPALNSTNVWNAAISLPLPFRSALDGTNLGYLPALLNRSPVRACRYWRSHNALPACHRRFTPADRRSPCGACCVSDFVSPAVMNACRLTCLPP